MAILFASPPDWVDNPGAYQFTATISGGIVLNINGEQISTLYTLNSIVSLAFSCSRSRSIVADIFSS